MNPIWQRPKNEPRDSYKSKHSDGFMLHFSFKKITALSILGSLLLVWVFFLGIIVGRGFNPEEKLPELAKIMPGSQNSTILQNTNLNATLEGGILKPEELQFSNKLKAMPQNTDMPAAPLQIDIPPKNKSKEELLAEQKKKDRDNKDKKDKQDKKEQDKKDKQDKKDNKDKKGKKDKNQKKNEKNNKSTEKNNFDKTQTGAENKAKTTDNNGKFNYTYQVAATTDKNGAEKLKAAIEAQGIKCFIEKSQNKTDQLYRIHVNFKGTPEDTRELRAKLQQLNINRIILKSKVLAAD